MNDEICHLNLGPGLVNWRSDPEETLSLSVRTDGTKEGIQGSRWEVTN